MQKGIIFSIEEFGINDGPGIRTVIFLKGCPLHCVWCHNPEGIAFEPQYLEKKTGRVMCGYSVDATELAHDILRNKAVFDIGHGGVTLSGGEPLAQPEFVHEFLQEVFPIHKSIETSGFASFDIFRRIVGLVDLVLFDIKHMNNKKHKYYTGVSNKQILSNLDYLISSEIPFVARIPLIPGVNDDDENMRAILSVIKDAKSLQRVELMPYNQLAGSKHYMIGKEYNPPFDPQTKPHITDIFKKNNINTIIL